ncbi:MAG: 50S ribosomal protein L9 [Dissulfurimicrobium sp.]|uniref:50S ribosomal protein L9 n=1 Tax=Dissulfurimicrobium TaxID=1769732 RepID=UPI001EDBDF9B|nr:50S ribosomal protein L9 [Dissulfurimicrobium hydrothermale]UKL14352.1 50S ribosomal protein L9 [Dissulfurimicrobium hydrothermale]
MEIILRESVRPLGKAGDVVKVASGYARNYLIPKGFALPFDKKNMDQIERQRSMILARASKLKAEYEALAAKLGGLDIEIKVRVGEEGRLYGSVTSMDIAKAVESKGYVIDRRKIYMDEPIKSVGEFDIPVKLSSDVSASLKVKVMPMEQ